MFYLIFLVFGVYLFYHLYWKRRNLPPGPVPLPLIGNLLTMASKKPGYEAFQQWRKEYGPIYTYWLGGTPVISVSDYPTITEVFVKNGDIFAGRVMFESSDIFRGGRYGIIETEGNFWREQRRFALHVLREFGLGKNLMQEKVLDEVSHMLKSLSTNEEKIVSLTQYFDICVGSIINNLLFGYRFEGSKLDEFFKLKKLLSNHFRMIMRPASLMIAQSPHIFKHLPYFSGIYDEIMTNLQTLFDFYRKQIVEHQKTFNDFKSSSEPTDVIEAYLREMNKEGAEDKGYKYIFSYLISYINAINNDKATILCSFEM